AAGLAAQRGGGRCESWFLELRRGFVHVVLGGGCRSCLMQRGYGRGQWGQVWVVAVGRARRFGVVAATAVNPRERGSGGDRGGEFRGDPSAVAEVDAGLRQVRHRRWLAGRSLWPAH